VSFALPVPAGFDQLKHGFKSLVNIQGVLVAHTQISSFSRLVYPALIELSSLVGVSSRILRRIGQLSEPQPLQESPIMIVCTGYPEVIMSDKQPIWIEQQSVHLIPIERQTLAVLGEEKAAFFLNAANDCVSIGAAVHEAYPAEKGFDLMLPTLGSLFKEARWFHTFFVTGNYSLLISRLRFIWESIFRAYFVEHYPIGDSAKWARPGPTLEEKMQWLEEHGHHLRLDTCIGPVVLEVFPHAARDQSIFENCKEIFRYLHQYAHPSAYLLDRKMINPALLFTDAFDEPWARQALEIGARVFALIWMAVFAHYPNAFEQVEPLEGKYPILSEVFAMEKVSDATKQG
jgi:hypothetical protein